jgi:hypothetical protein
VIGSTTKKENVYCEVQAEPLNVIQVNISLFSKGIIHGNLNMVGTKPDQTVTQKCESYQCGCLYIVIVLCCIHTCVVYGTKPLY